MVPPWNIPIARANHPESKGESLPTTDFEVICLDFYFFWWLEQKQFPQMVVNLMVMNLMGSESVNKSPKNKSKLLVSHIIQPYSTTIEILNKGEIASRKGFSKDLSNFHINPCLFLTKGVNTDTF